MATHTIGTREEWLSARLDLLAAEKDLTRRSDEVARQRQELPWVRVDKDYRFETDEGTATLTDLFKGRSQLLVYHFMFGPDYRAGMPVLLGHRGRFQRLRRPSRESRRAADGRVARAAREAAGLQAAHGMDVSVGVVVRRRLQLRLQRVVHGRAAARGASNTTTRLLASGIGAGLARRPLEGAGRPASPPALEPTSPRTRASGRA